MEIVRLEKIKNRLRYYDILYWTNYCYLYARCRYSTNIVLGVKYMNKWLIDKAILILRSLEQSQNAQNK